MKRHRSCQTNRIFKKNGRPAYGGKARKRCCKQHLSQKNNKEEQNSMSQCGCKRYALLVCVLAKLTP